ncbi:MAG: ATP-binding protein [Hydrogenoanaerobacterium sp.]
MILFSRMFLGCILQMMPFAFLCFYPFHQHFRYSKKKIVAITALLIFTLGIIFAATSCYLKFIYPPGQALFNYANGVFMCCLVPCLVWYLYAVKEIWQKKLFVFMFALTSALAMTSIGTVIETKLQLGKDMDGLPYYGTVLLTLAILTVIVLPLLLLLLKYCYLPVSEGLSKKESGSLSVLSLLLFAVLSIGLVPLGYDQIYNPVSLTLYFTLLAAVFIIYVVCFQMLHQAHEKLMAQQSLSQVRHQLEIHDEQYKRISDNIESSRKIRHNLKHHTLALQSYFASGEIKKAEDYLKQYALSLNEYELEKLCDNTIVNTVVNYYRNVAEEKEIAFTIRIAMPKELTVPDCDMAVLLGNLLENAITAAESAEKDNRAIDLNIICSGKMLAITVDNGFDGKTNKPDGEYLSTKEKHIGIGLESIKSIAESYGGGVEFTHDAQTFHASVMLGVG